LQSILIHNAFFNLCEQKNLMHLNQHIIRKTLAYALPAFPIVLILAFAMHIHSPGEFLNYRLKPEIYNPDQFFEVLTTTGGGNFVHTHSLAYLSVPFMILTVLCLGYLLYPEKPFLSLAGVVTGIAGAVFMAGFFGAWLSFSAISRVEVQYYAGAKAALAELTRFTGIFKMITRLACLTLFGMIVLCIGLFNTKLLPRWSPVSIIAGCLLICIFWSLISWMLTGAILIFTGLLPVSQLLKNKTNL
jgi:hypothetical protein